MSILDNKMIRSGLVGAAIVVFFQLLPSAILDDYIGDEAANAVGLVLEAVADLFGQSWAMGSSFNDSPLFLAKFLGVKVGTVLYSQFLFDKALKPSRPLFRKYMKAGLNATTLTLLRVAVNVVVFFTATFPLRKYVLFPHHDAKLESKEPSDKPGGATPWPRPG